MTTLIDAIRGRAAGWYGVRDRIGAAKAKILRVAREWPGSVGRGLHKDWEYPILPSPRVVDLAVRRMVSPHGQSLEADLLLTTVIENQFDGQKVLGNNIADDLLPDFLLRFGVIPPENAQYEFFYKINDKLCSVAAVTRRQVTWGVVLKKTNKGVMQ